MEQKKIILSIKNLVVKFRVRSRVLTSIRNVSFDIYDGETVAIVGESGSGKSVLTKTLTNMLENNGYIANGEIFYYPTASASSDATSYFKENIDLVQFHKGAMEIESRKGIRKYNHLRIKRARKQIKILQNLDAERLNLQISALETQLANFGDYEATKPNHHKLKQRDRVLKKLHTAQSQSELAINSQKANHAILALETEITKAYQEIANFNLLHPWNKIFYSLDVRALKKYSQILSPKNALLDNSKSQRSQQSQEYQAKQKKMAQKILVRLNHSYLKLKKLPYKNDFETALFQSLQQLITHPTSPLSEAEIKTLDEAWRYFRRGAVTIRAQARRDLKHLRGGTIATIFQDPMTSLNPLLSVGYQIGEVLRVHRGMNHNQAKAETIKLMEKVGIPNPEQRYHDLPGKYSGGMRQRIVIAVALAAQPKILICDEPTTALDVTIQAQILELIRDLKKEFGFTVIFITHDLGVVANIADRVAVVYAGQIIEYGGTEEIFFNAQHPYTWALLSSLPQLGEKGQELYSIPGSPPSLFTELKGDAFAPRNKYALAVDYEYEPPFFSISSTHAAKTWLLDPRAPKVERPKELSLLRKAVGEAQVGGDI